MSNTRIDLEIGDRFFATMPYSQVCTHLGVADRVMEVEVRQYGAQLLKDGREFSFPITWGEAGIYIDSITGNPYTYNADKVGA
ncbi:hypothetical protein [Streptomyces sp. NPDC017260]|uniref:hypothetical protein n=1 Tax=unclassified Streptomyces TaxID=2593676 RepID=UPI0037A7DA01